MKVLLTGFGIFHDFKVNPTEVLVNAFKDIPKVTLKKVVFKVDFELVATEYKRILADFDPDLIINLGLSAATTTVLLEEFALNSAAPDQNLIMEKGPAAYRTDLPLTALCQKINEAQIPCQVSQHAGTYLCNFIYYHSLYFMQQKAGRAVFVHLPFSSELACDLAMQQKRVYPSLPMAYLQRAVELIVEEVQDAQLV